MVLRGAVPPLFYLALEYFVLTPSFLPPLVVMVSVLSVFHFFPFGFWGVVGMHTLFELGMVSVFLSRCFYKRMEPYDILFVLHHKTLFQRIVLLVGLCRRDLLMISGLLFVFFFTSLSIPIIMSGGGFTSLEYTMYTLFKNSNDWQAVLPLYFIQVGIIGFVLFANVKTQMEDTFLEKKSTVLNTKGRMCSFLSITPAVVVFVGLFLQVGKGFLSAQREGLVFLNSILGTVLIGFLSSSFVFLFLLILTYFYQAPKSRKYLQLWTIPSFVVMGFLFQNFYKPESTASYFYLAGILAYLFVPTVAKLGLYQQIEGLDSQIEMAQILGSSYEKTFLKITFPLLLPWLAILSGLAGLWAMGDFAISRIFLHSDLTLSLKIQSLMGQYRWDQAIFLSWILLLSSFFVFLFFGGLAYVAHQKLK
ncbi:hypothetical protein K2X05_13140 [bacterium]|nr:hypothetical protein [bacterium]